MRSKRAAWIGGSVVVVLAVGAVGVWYALRAAADDPFMAVYGANCAVCHGEDMAGGPQGPALIGGPLAHGESIAELVRSIADGYPASGMPGWSATHDDAWVRSLAILIAERRVDRLFTDFKMAKPLVVPSGTIHSEAGDFHVQVVATGLDPYPFSIAPLVDHSILVTEKTPGLLVLPADGGTPRRVTGTPTTSGFGVNVMGLNYGVGWLLDVAPHPDYEHNGWIYLLHAHLCEDCGEDGDETMLPVSMNRVVRGRIRVGPEDGPPACPFAASYARIAGPS
jgi:hypothetical protein